MSEVYKIETEDMGTLYEKQLLRIVAEEPNMTLTELSDAVNRSASWIFSQLDLSDLEPRIRAHIKADTMSISNAYRLMQIVAGERDDFVTDACFQSSDTFAETVRKHLNP